MEPQHEWLRLQSLHAECLFWRGDFERAESVFEAASLSREEAGIRDWHYIRQRRYAALSKRGLCDFTGCSAALDAALVSARENGLADVIPRLEDDIRTTGLIRRGAFHSAAVVHRVTLVGPQGVEVLGDDRIPLQGCDSLNHNCKVSECSFVMDEPFRLRLRLAFSVDNVAPVSDGPISDGYPGSRTPILFGIVLPKGAAVHYGDFSLELNHPDTDWREKFFFLQNEFATVFHPESYPPNGFHPIPRCKTYNYVRGDFCIFRSPLPRDAEVSFAGTITYPPRWAGADAGSIELTAGILLPYKAVSFASVRTACSVEGAREVPGRIATTAYLADCTDYSPGVTPLAPKEGFVAGQSTVLDSSDCAKRGCDLRHHELLTVTLGARLDRDLAVSPQHQAHVIPTGIFDHVKRPERRSSEGGISLADETIESVPLLRCILLNTQASPRSLELTTSCDALFSPTRQTVEVPASGIAVVNVKPRIGDDQRLFAGQGESDYDCGPKTVRATIAVRERRLAGLIRQKRIDKLRLELTALPTDYMVWAVANHADARFLNLRGLIARWVTPLAPAVQNFVHALRKEPSDAHFDAGLKRVYEGLRALRFTYDTKRVNFGTTMEHDFQRVRLPSKSLAHRQINCIDGTVLLASVVEALGYRPAVVFIPGHAFLALLFGEDMNSISRILCIESTGLCRGTGGSGISYEEATRVGLAQFEEHREKLFGKERDVTRFEIVPIERSRAEGIQGFGE